MLLGKFQFLGQVKIYTSRLFLRLLSLDITCYYLLLLVIIGYYLLLSVIICYYVFNAFPVTLLRMNSGTCISLSLSMAGWVLGLVCCLIALDWTH